MSNASNLNKYDKTGKTLMSSKIECNTRSYLDNQ